jgi:hypothetical protein
MGIMKFPELPKWIFNVVEVSAGAYRVSGKDEMGRSISLSGFDDEKLLLECKEYAAQILKQDASSHTSNDAEASH